MRIKNFSIKGFNTEYWNWDTEYTEQELQTILKTANVSFYVEGATRDQTTLLCELGLSYVQQSQRYVSADGYSIERMMHEDISETAKNLINKSISLYERMTKKKDENKKGRLTRDDFEYGIPYEDGRYILPLAMKSNIKIAMTGDKLLDLVRLFNRYSVIFGGWLEQLKTFIDTELFHALTLFSYTHTECVNNVERYYANFYNDIKPNEILSIDIEDMSKDVVFGGLTSTSLDPIEQMDSDYYEPMDFINRVAYGYGHMGITEQSRNTCGMCLSLSAYHQYIRHRLNSNRREMLTCIALDSSRGFYIPESIANSPFVDEYKELVKEYFIFFAKELYYYDIQLLSIMLLNCMYVKFVTSSNARNDAYIFRERLCLNAQTEIRELMDKKYQLLREKSPAIYNKAVPPCVYGACKEGKMTCGKAAEMRDKYRIE